MASGPPQITKIGRLERPTDATDGSAPHLESEARKNEHYEATPASRPLVSERSPMATMDFDDLVDRLHPDQPNAERLQAYKALLASSGEWSVEHARSILQQTRDLLLPDGDIELKTAGLRLLQSVAVRPELSQLHSETLVIALQSGLEAHIRDQVTIFYNIVSRKDIQGTDEVWLDPTLTHRVAQYVIEQLQGMFDSAETARKEHHTTRKPRGETSDANPASRPDEEIAFIRALKILQVLIRTGNVSTTLNDETIELASHFLKQTTGKTIMTALLESLQLAFPHTSRDLANLEDCISLLCQISDGVSSKAQMSAYQTLCRVLRCHLGPRVMQHLVDGILGRGDYTQSLRIVVLRALAEAYFCEDSGPDRRISLPTDIARLCNKVECTGLTKDSIPFAQPLLEICLATCSHIGEGVFDILVEKLQMLAALDSKSKTGDRTMNAVFVEGLIKLFLGCFHQHGRSAARVYEMLISILAMVESAPVKLAIIKLMARLRCDSKGAVQIVRFLDSHHLAASLCRTTATTSSARDSISPASKKSNTSHSSLSNRDGSQKSMNLARRRSRSRSTPKKFRESFRLVSQPLWIYEDGRQGLPATASEHPSKALSIRKHNVGRLQEGAIDPDLWLDFVIDVLRNGNDWETYSYVLVHLPSQLSNSTLFCSCIKQISILHDLLSEHLSESLFPDAPAGSNVRKGDIALCLYSSLAMLLGYQESIGVRQWNRVVSTFRLGIEKWDRTGKLCIHALSVCCHEIPHILSNHLNIIVEMMQKRITHPEIAADILEFLGGLSRLPEVWERSDFALHQKIFSICIRYLQHSREQRAGPSSVPSSPSPAGNRSSHGVTSAQAGPRLVSGDLAHRKFHEYVFTTAYQVMIFWFLALDVSERHRHVAWITQELSFKNEAGKEDMEPQSLVFLDLMHRTAFSDLGETRAEPQFAKPGPGIHRRTWLMGMSVVTAEFLVNDATGRISHGQFTKRQASGTTHAIYYHNTEEMPSHQEHQTASSSRKQANPFSMYPNHMILQLVSTISPLPAPLQPIPLPDNDESTDRLLRVFDATDTVDGHKAAVIYVGRGQSKGFDILSNAQGSAAFDTFVSRLAFKVPLRDAKFNTQGLDRVDGSDGSYTYAWRDRVTEIVFHIPTMMPTSSDNDPTFLRKMSHIGNDHVKIIFNESGLEYDPNTFESDFNSINIVITPEAPLHDGFIEKDAALADDKKDGSETATTYQEEYYIVQTYTSGDFPAISPTAKPKIISMSGLPTLIRQLALNASVLCQVWSQNVGEYTSCWLFRLQQITKLRERHAAANVSSNVGYPQAADAGPSSHFDGQVWTGTVSHGGLAEQEKLVSSLDFTRWTK